MASDSLAQLCHRVVKNVKQSGESGRDRSRYLEALEADRVGNAAHHRGLRQNLLFLAGLSRSRCSVRVTLVRRRVLPISVPGWRVHERERVVRADGPTLQGWVSWILR